MARLGRARGLVRVGRALPAHPEAAPRAPGWKEASPGWIQEALARSQRLPGGGWYVLDASRALDKRPRRFLVRNRALVAWRAGQRLVVGPDACPHLGASLAGGEICSGRLRCRWHGLELGPEGRGAWQPLPSWDDGVLLWARLDHGEQPTERPSLPRRPPRRVEAVIRVEARCDPADVVANRLDPWHGPHLHAYAFARLRVLDLREDEVTVRVAYRLAGPVAVEVDARFHCVDPRTIVMTIVEGEGRGSVVETHATPMEPGRTAIVEAILATSDRRGLALARRAGFAARWWLERAARRLWKDDAAYAERRYQLADRKQESDI